MTWELVVIGLYLLTFAAIIAGTLYFLWLSLTCIFQNTRLWFRGFIDDASFQRTEKHLRNLHEENQDDIR